MTAEGYRVSLEDIINNVNPIKRGDKPVLKAEPGALDVAIVRVDPDENKSFLTLYCEKDNSETKIYRVNPQAILTTYGRLGKWRMLIADSEEDRDFAFTHEMTLFPNSQPIYIKAEDEYGNRSFLMLVHR